MAEVLVIGGSAIDLKAAVDSALIPETSNPGTVTATPGGVGRNIAENLARLGTSVRLLSRVGDDAFGRFVLAETAAAGVDVTAVRTDAEHTATYAATLDHDGSLSVAVADFAALDTMTPDHLDPAAFDGVQHVVLDANLPVPVLSAAITRGVDVGAMVTIEPVSVAKAARLAQLSDGFSPAHLITPNEAEYAALAELIDPLLIATWVCLRRGAAGSRVIYGPGTDPVDISAVPVPENEIRDVTGAGDAATAGLIHALVHGGSLEEAVAFGHEVAAHTVRSERTVATDLADLMFTPTDLPTEED
ncbi:MAG: carbohydrate kinase family protein [Actinomycetia bacterium]|nr:carbohydrate kinase family protein [Actinomycetes bacterium]